MRTLRDGIAFGESPRWHDGRLWFADWVTNEVIATDLDGNSEIVARVESFPMCIDFLPDGRLLIVHSDKRELLVREPEGTLAEYADLKAAADQPYNDIVVDGRGNAYLGIIGASHGDDPSDRIALVTPDGSARVVGGDVVMPNGMLVTPDNSTLIVAESDAHRLTAFDINADGDLSNQRVWAEVPDAAPDGICMDAEGAVWFASVPRQQCVRVAEGGEVLDTVDADRGCFACMLGGPDRSTLFVVAAKWPEAMQGGDRTGLLLAAPAPAPGVGWPCAPST